MTGWLYPEDLGGGCGALLGQWSSPGKPLRFASLKDSKASANSLLIY